MPHKKYRDRYVDHTCATPFGWQLRRFCYASTFRAMSIMTGSTTRLSRFESEAVSVIDVNLSL